MLELTLRDDEDSMLHLSILRATETMPQAHCNGSWPDCLGAEKDDSSGCMACPASRLDSTVSSGGDVVSKFVRPRTGFTTTSTGCLAASWATLTASAMLWVA